MSLTSSSSGSPTPSPSAAGKSLPPELMKAMNKVTEIASLPEVTAKIVQVVEDPRATAKDIHDVVQSDPALAAKALKIVNSAFYGLPSQIASLERAILMLGLTAVKNLALATSLSRIIKADQISDHFGPRDLWRHCVAVGVCSRALASAAKSTQTDEAFVAGLVHDMGLIIVQQLFPQRLRDVAETCYCSPQNFCAAEEAAIGADHQAFGGVMATKWKFPPGLRNAIAYHHEPRSLQPEFQKVAAMVYVADTLCSHNKYGFWLTSHTQDLSEEVLDLVGLTREQINAVGADLPARIEEAEQIFTAD
jgi:HD-like signal output (HDOD) protein